VLPLRVRNHAMDYGRVVIRLWVASIAFTLSAITPSLDGAMYEDCGRTFLTKDGCCLQPKQVAMKSGSDEDLF
jgi:hypothetical protein